MREPSRLELALLRGDHWKIIGKILKYGIAILAIGYVVLLLLRLFTSGDTAVAKEYIRTEAAIELHEASPFTVKKISYPNEYSDGRKEGEHLFRVSHIYYAEATGELQATVRFNDSVTEQAVPTVDGYEQGEVFVFALRDNLGRYYTDYTYLADEKNVLNYRRLLFTGISTEGVSSFDLLVYTVGDKDPEDPYATFPGLFNVLQAYQTVSSGELYGGAPTEKMLHPPVLPLFDGVARP